MPPLTTAADVPTDRLFIAREGPARVAVLLLVDISRSTVNTVPVRRICSGHRKSDRRFVRGPGRFGR
jgi:hypothetical protein